MNYVQSCCGKVNIVYDRKNIIGYIIGESKERWKILLASNIIVYKKPLFFSKEDGDYIYPSLGKYVITMYHPIRILMKVNGRGMKITLNRVAYKKQEMITM